MLPNPGEDDATATQWARALALSPQIAAILRRRGFTDVEDAKRYLEPALAHLHPPSALLGLPEAVARIQTAVARGEKILLYGDYDVDGTSAIVILKTTLDLLGAIPEAFVPHRLRDGYGMKGERIEQAARDGVRLIISVDTGIRAGEVVRRASELGIDTIVTDHHLPEEEIPPAVAVLNPNRPGCSYPNKNLCGAGVALKLAEGLLAASSIDPARQTRIVESLLKMAALATVADIVPLDGENRAIVKLGLEGMRQVKNPGLRALLDASGIQPGTAPTARQVGFQIGPRINAAGRMESASEVLELFSTPSLERAREIAGRLSEFNRERQDTEEEMKQAIYARLHQDPAIAHRLGLVLYGEDWHLGVAGIVAGRIAEKQRKPTFVLAGQQQNGQRLIKGSGRSIPGFHLLEALESMKSLFVQHGGHAQAAGVTLEESALAEFTERFDAYAQARLNDEMRRPVVAVDAVVGMEAVTERLYLDCQRLTPFGYGNPPPLFAVLGVEPAAPPTLLKEKHLKFIVRAAGRPIAFKAWNMADHKPLIAPGRRLDIAFALEHDSFDGWSPIVQALRPSEG